MERHCLYIYLSPLHYRHQTLLSAIAVASWLTMQAPSSTRDVPLHTHMRNMTRILSQLDLNAFEYDLYEPINETLVEFSRSLECEDFIVTTHPQAMILMRGEGECYCHELSTTYTHLLE